MNKIIQRRPLPEQINLPDHLHPILKRVLAARHVETVTELDYSLSNLLPYASLLGIQTAVDLLEQALIHQARILIVADYDADGATSCVVAIKALRQMGVQKVGFLVPNREKHGYGLTPEIVELAVTDSWLVNTAPGLAPDLLITVDNGISSLNAVAVAKRYGMQVLITDHHLAPAQLPQADAIVNPNQPGDTFPSKSLCGVGVIFYIMLALRSRLRENGWFATQKITEPNLANLLDLVALGTVADVVSLDYNNRILVEQGLRRIRANRCCPGIRALVQVSGREQTHLVASDLAFYLGPRLNAAGRMDDMSHGIACLLSEEDTNAVLHAQSLQEFNQERRGEEAKMHQEALEMITTLGDFEKIPVGLCLLEEQWHQGIVGILAARIKEQLHRPVIIFTSDKDNQIRGSGRSVPGVHLRDILANIAAQYPQLITRFGGHAMAAGITIPHNQFARFQAAFDQMVRQHLAPEQLHGVILSDGALSPADFNLELAEQLQTLTPWGQHFPEPIFDGEFELLTYRRLKDKHLKMQVRPRQGKQTIEVIAFNFVTTDWPSQVNYLHLAYKLDVNHFRGWKNLQLRAEYIAVLS